MNLHQKYKPLWESEDWNIAIVIGGRASGKSFAISDFVENLSFERNQIILYARYTMVSSGASTIPEFLEKVEMEGHEDYFTVNKTEITNLYSDSKILFKGIKAGSKQQSANLKSIKGLSTLIIEEAEELTDEDEFDIIDKSIRSKLVKNRIILILNPTTKEHWIYRRFFEDAGIDENFAGVKNRVLYINTDYRDNKSNLSERFLFDAEQMKRRRPEKYKHILLGKWLQVAEGVIFNNWNIGEFQEHSPTVYGQDYGFSIDPTTLVATSIDSSKKIIYLKN